jgi:hypothetical protein
MEFNETKKSHGGGEERGVNPDISRVDQEQIDEEFNKRNPSVGKIRALLERRVRERFRRTACFSMYLAWEDPLAQGSPIRYTSASHSNHHPC